MSQNTLKYLINSIFNRPNPLPPFSLELTYDGIHISQVFKDITKIFMAGINMKYGNDNAINILELTDYKMNNIKEYMYAIGITYSINFIDNKTFVNLQRRSIFYKTKLSDYHFYIHIEIDKVIIVNFDYYCKPTVWNRLL